jgi:hypothetical protein
VNGSTKVRPVFMSRGEHLLGGLDLDELGYAVVETIPGERATHIVIRRSTRL